PTEPFIGNDAEGILVAGRAGMGGDLFGSHISNGTRHILCAIIMRTMRNQSDPEIAEEDLVMLTNEHILRLDVTVYDLAIMRILQCLRNLLDIVDHGRDGKWGSFRVAITQSATRSVVH